jgi:hypothetical protein
MSLNPFSSTSVTYSFKDLVGALVNSVFGVTVSLAGGNIGIGQITIAMSTARTSQDVAADGVVMPSYLAGNNGTCTIEVQQTSALHHALLGLYNLSVTAADNGDVTGWAATVISFRTQLDGSTHVLSGVSFNKIPDKPYHASGSRVSWELMACNIVNT